MLIIWHEIKLQSEFLMSCFDFQYNGVRGYGPKAMLRENKKFVSKNKVTTIVSTEFLDVEVKEACIKENIVVSSRNSFFGGIIGASAAEQNIKPDKVRVVEGTTLYNMEITPGDENVAADYVTPDGLDGLPLPMEQVPERTTTPTIEPSKSDLTVQSESVNKINDNVEKKSDSSDDGKTKQSLQDVASDENIHTDQEYTDYEEDEDEEAEEAEVEDESEEMNSIYSTEESGKELVFTEESGKESVSAEESGKESVSATDVKNATDKIIEQQQDVQGTKTIHSVEPSDIKVESSDQSEPVESVKSEQCEVTSVSEDNEQNMKIDKGKQHAADISPQTPETVEQSDVHVDSPLTAKEKFHINIDSNKVSISDSSLEQPVVTRAEINIDKKGEKEAEITVNDQTSASGSSGSEIVQQDPTTEDTQKIEETPSVEHVDSMLQENSSLSEEPALVVGDSEKTVEDNVSVIKNLNNLELDSDQQQFMSSEGHTDENSDTGKSAYNLLQNISNESSETENVGTAGFPEEASTDQSIGVDSNDNYSNNLPQNISNESNETENVGIAGLPVEASADQSVGVDSNDNSAVQQEEEIKPTEDVASNNEAEKPYDSQDAFKQDSLPFIPSPEILLENSPNEEPSISEEASKESFSKDYITNIMESFSSFIRTVQHYFQPPIGYSDIPNTVGEEPLNIVSSDPESIVESRENWDQSKSDSLKGKD